MPLRVRYGAANGNTVPYPPLFDEVRGNHGFVDTRGRIDRVAEIPEARQSEGLRSLLEVLAKPNSPFISLGCDLGQRDRAKSRLSRRKWAGGYVQIAIKNEDASDREFENLRYLAKAVEEHLHEQSVTDLWEVQFILAPVHMNFEVERRTQSAWIWFDAKASTADSALDSRERLLIAIGEAISDLRTD